MFASGHLGQKPAVGEGPAGRCVCGGERDEDGAFLSLDGAEMWENFTGLRRGMWKLAGAVAVNRQAWCGHQNSQVQEANPVTWVMTANPWDKCLYDNRH